MPRLNPACDIRSLPLSPVEGFVLSRIDGRATLAEVAALTGLGAALEPVLIKLVELGAVLDSGNEVPKKVPPPPPPVSPPPVSGPVSSQPFSGPVSSQPVSSAAHAAPRSSGPVHSAPASSGPTIENMPFAVTERPPPMVDEEALREEVDLDEATKRTILELFARLDDTHYVVLQVPPTATKKEIKSAYYRLAPSFHPDKYFRKNLGTFKAKMEALFGRLTTAHDVLTAKDKRAEYDTYLSLRAETAHVDDALNTVPVEQLRETPLIEEPPLSFVPSERATSAVSVPLSPEDQARRRNAMAARLKASTNRAVGDAADKGGSATKSVDKSQSPEFGPEPITSSREKAEAGLRQIYANAKKGPETHKQKALRYVELARASAERGDAVAASNAYRLALDFAPDDPDVAAELGRWSKQAASTLAESYLKQGEYELSNGRATDAVRSFSRARLGATDNPVVLERLGFAMLKAGADLHEAVDHLRKALTLAPKNAQYHATLAELYMAANLDGAAKRSIEAAFALDSVDPRIAALRKRLTS